MYKSNAKIGIWLLIANGEIIGEYYSEKSAIIAFNEYLLDEDNFTDDVQVVRVLRTTKINNYENLATFGDYKICPSVENIEGEW